jgi:ATP-dependent DNA helicase RecQ
MTALLPSHPGDDVLLEGLRKHFGLGAFRAGQAEVIASVMAGRNTVAVMPTGAGKSLCYQLPATLLDGVTLVVSPLISLMHDQVEQLKARGIAAAFLNSTLSDLERAERMTALRDGRLKLLYCAPERLRSEPLLEALAPRLSLLAVDEAHCISQWGHDFRPDYALLGQLRKRLRPLRTLAVTATATPEVRADIMRSLLLKEPRFFTAGFDRPNLFLEVLSVNTDADKLDACLKLSAQGSGVVYCSTRKQADALHASLEKKGVEAVLYHAGLDDDARRRAQDAFMSSERAVAVATNAFGMGIDKPAIRFVAHAGIPRAVEAYYQEIGRAGRDGKPAHAVLLFNHADVFTQERLIEGSHPPGLLVADVWNTVEKLGQFDKGLGALAACLGAHELEVGAALKILERGGHLKRSGRGEGQWEFARKENAVEPKGAAARTMLQCLSGMGTSGAATLQAFATRSQLGEREARHALHLLEKGGWISLKKPFAGRIITAVSRGTFDMLDFSLEHVRLQEHRALLLLRRMTDYAYTRRCRRAFILRYFGEKPASGPCKGCDVCAGHQLSAPPKPAPGAVEPDEPRYSVLAFEELRKWRTQLARSLSMAPYLVFNDATLRNLAAALPTTRDEFLAVKGTGETRWERFGPRVIAVSVMARAAGDVPVPLASSPRRRR